ncbi:MAG: hypothetical protein JOZ69_16470, partial [Myxococcales bacterium]|nr:hypothetical protein [Myxococcales bacterium]
MTQDPRSLFLVGGFAEEVTRSMAEAAGSVGLQTAVVGRCEEAPDTLGQAVDPLAIVLRMDAEGAPLACAHVRGQARLAQLPILCVAANRDDLAFTELFSWGADDLVATSSAPALARRLRPLVARTPAKRDPKPRDRCAIVAGSDARWRSVMGRALYQGCFSVRFVGDPGELAAESMAEGVRVVVFADDTGAAAEPALAAARARGSDAAWIVVAPPKRMAALIASIGSLAGVSVADGYAPPENVLFLTNELLSRRGVDQRASPRVLYGTTVAFRQAGRDEDEIGFSYNV